MRLTSRMPTMFSPVISAMLPMIHTLAGTVGKICFM